jgi:hypothetical protein
MTIRHYHQCQNFECSITFTTLNSVEKLVTKRGHREKLPLIYPRDAFLHRIMEVISSLLPYKMKPRTGFL